MEPIIISKPKRVDQWMNDYISPGPVAPLGYMIVNEQLKKSCPELLPRYSFSNSSLARRGAGVQDGTWYNEHNGALSAKVNRQSFYDKSYNNTSTGITMQDLRLQDLKADSRMLGAPQFGWKSLKANTLNARVTGEQFLPVPQGYKPTGQSRGNPPRINMLVDNTTAIAPIAPLPPLPSIVENVPTLDDRGVNGQGVENIQQAQRNLGTQFRGGLGRF